VADLVAAAKTTRPASVVDIDADDFFNPQSAADYVQDIYDYLRNREDTHPVNARYMLRQLDINQGMRKLLANWMIEVAIEFQLMSETLFLSVSLLDQFLQLRQVPRDRLQLLGMTAMFIASKYEEIWHPPVEDFIHICVGTYERDEILKMELYMLQTLEYNLSFVTPLQFLRRFSKAARSDPRLHTCCKYFLELSLPQYGMLSFKPSMVAAAAVYLGRKLAGKKPAWDDTLEYYTTYSEEQIMPCVKSIVHVLRKEAAAGDDGQSRPVTDKYADKQLYRVSTIVLDFYTQRLARAKQQQQQQQKSK
jgi:Cyclin, N-terminal domain/Cyclin, C-terminal domain